MIKETALALNKLLVEEMNTQKRDITIDVRKVQVGNPGQEEPV